MAWYKADLHLHSVLSPCATLEMSPAQIVERAVEAGLQIIGLTDHNSTRNTTLISKLAARAGIFCLRGVEINTREEVHCLLFVETDDQLSEVEEFLQSRLPDIQNNPEIFGYQLILDEEENIVEQVDRLLINAISATLDEVAKLSERLGGIFIPAHIDKSKNSILSQLGFIPPDLKYSALELSRHATPAAIIAKHPYLKNALFTTSSDAHQPDLVGSVCCQIECSELTFAAIREAIINHQVKI